MSEVRFYSDATRPTFCPGQTVHLEISPRLHWHVGVELKAWLPLDTHVHAHTDTSHPKGILSLKKRSLLFHGLTNSMLSTID